MYSKLIFAALLLAAAMPATSQTAPAAIESSWRVEVGGGVSQFHDDFFGSGLMEGPTVWVDGFPNRGPKYIHNLGLELEIHDISMGGPQPIPSLANHGTTSREDTFGGGPIYEWRHFKRFTPYGKFLWEQGSIDFNVGVPGYTHDNRSVSEAGAGFELKLVHHISFRAEFEKQWWQRLFENHQIVTPTGIALEPRGVTVGAMYEFDRLHFGGPAKQK